jgi:hypothetical protein
MLKEIGNKPCGHINNPGREMWSSEFLLLSSSGASLMLKVFDARINAEYTHRYYNYYS